MTTRNRARLLIMRSYASCALSSGNVSVMGSTPVIAENFIVSSESIDGPEGQARWIETALELFTGQPAEERRELLHPGGTECLQHVVAEFVGVSNLLAAADQVTSRLFAFPCRPGEEKVQAVPHALEVTMRPVVGGVVILRRLGVRIYFEDRHRRQLHQPAEDALWAHLADGWRPGRGFHELLDRLRLVDELLDVGRGRPVEPAGHGHRC